VPRQIDPFEKWRNVPMPPIKGEEREVKPEPESVPVAAAPKGSKKATLAGAAKKSAARETEAKPAPKAAAKPAAKPAAASAPKPAQKKAATSNAKKDEPSGLRRLFGLSKPDPKPAKKKKASGDRS
jgi:hypothetical protein